eukprot:1179264-Prorocentrum_minimum.AAC.1
MMVDEEGWTGRSEQILHLLGVGLKVLRSVLIMIMEVVPICEPLHERLDRGAPSLGDPIVIDNRVPVFSPVSPTISSFRRSVSSNRGPVHRSLRRVE